jgi:hypothetical protein
MRATQALHFLKAKAAPTPSWMKDNYSHFQPDDDDRRLRAEMLREAKKAAKAQETKQPETNVNDIFDDES